LKNLFKRLENLEKKWNEKPKRKRSALILCDAELPQDFCDFKVDADAVLILPDNGHRGAGKKAPKGSYSVYYH
jgi:hypothetical protein